MEFPFWWPLWLKRIVLRYKLTPFIKYADEKNDSLLKEVIDDIIKKGELK